MTKQKESAEKAIRDIRRAVRRQGIPDYKFLPSLAIRNCWKRSLEDQTR